MITQEYIRWRENYGDSTHRLYYDLNKDSVVFDLGGYVGDWAHQIYNLYGCKLFIFEPIKKYFDIIKESFNNNPDVTIMNVAAYDKDTVSYMNMESDASSLTEVPVENSIEIRTINIVDFIKTKGITSIDLMKINIEGSEYDVLDAMIKNDLHRIVKNFQIQYHRNVANYEQRRTAITKALSKTHDISYMYEYVWEGWKVK